MKATLWEAAFSKKFAEARNRQFDMIQHVYFPGVLCLLSVFFSIIISIWAPLFVIPLFGFSALFVFSLEVREYINDPGWNGYEKYLEMKEVERLYYFRKSPRYRELLQLVDDEQE